MSPAKDRFKPVRPDNVPSTRPDPDDDEPTQPAPVSPPATEQPDASQPASELASNVASKQANQQAGNRPLDQRAVAALLAGTPSVPGRRSGRGLTMGDIMHGRADPETDYAQSGVRLPRYVLDAVRVVVATSRGQWNGQRLVTEAVKAFIPPEILVEAWREHGGKEHPPGIDDIEEQK